LIVKAFDNTNLRTIVISSILVFIIGLVDEFIQWLLPNRVGDLRDVAMNTIGGLLGIWFGKALYS
jgi:VanZ family protein